MSAPSGSSSLSAKKPPAPLPASTTILKPSKGLSSGLQSNSSRIFLLSPSIYGVMISTVPEMPCLETDGRSPDPARFRISAMSAFSRPPSAIKNFIPLRSIGRWLAVTIMPASKRSSFTQHMNIAGVLAIPPSKALAPTAVMPEMSHSVSCSPESLESLPIAILSSLMDLSSFMAAQIANAAPMRVELSSLRFTSLPPATAIATPRISLPF